MAKKKFNDADFDVPASTFNASAAVAKLPTDVQGGKEALNDFMNLPISCLVPFGLKDNSDFTRPSGSFYEGFVASVKEMGIIEVITVRPKPDGQYEILAGETRWSAAKDAGLQRIPAHIIHVDDATARKIFAWTNLLRRDLKVSDRINGWWQYYTGAKEEGKLDSLRDNTKGDGLNQYVPSTDRISYRQIMRYVKMHNLTPEWIDLLEANPDTGKPPVTIRIGSEIAKLSTERQTDLLPFATKLTDQTVSLLLSLDKGDLKSEKGEPYSWSESNIRKIIGGRSLDSTEENSTSEEAPALKLNKLKSGIMKIAKNYLRPEDYGKAPEIIQEALEMYYKAKQQA